MKAVLDKDETLKIELRGGWYTEVRGNGDGTADIETYNLDPNTGRKRWYSVTSLGNKYGGPLMYEEPDLGIKLEDVGVPGIDDRLVGFVSFGPDGKVERKSFSNTVFMEKKTLDVTAEGALVINGEVVGYLAVIFMSNKARIKGYVGIFIPTKPSEPVKIMEMEDAAVEVAKSLM